MNKAKLLKYLLENNANISFIEVCISMIVTVLIGLFIYWTYKKTYSGVKYSKDFNVTIILVALVTSMVIMIIGSNLALSLGMVGALSIIRFRTAIKDPKDVGFLFWAVGVGLSTGTGIYVIGIFGSIFIAAVLFFLNRGAYNDSCYLLIVKGRAVNFEELEAAIKKNTKKYKLKMKTNSRDFVDATYEIDLDGSSDVALVEEIKALENIESINIISYNGEIAG